MTYKLTATITHKSFDAPVVKEFYYHADSLDGVISQIDTLPEHLHNLKHHMKASFKDARGVKHVWHLQHIQETN